MKASESAPLQSFGPVPWLPNLCALTPVFLLMLVAQLVVLIALLAPQSGPDAFWQRVGAATLLAQWIVLTCIPLLCSLRARLLALGPIKGGALVTVMCMLVAAVVAYMVRIANALLAFDAPRDELFVPKIALMAALVAVAALRYGYVHELWKSQVRAKANAELDALQARIRPHFLFNSLNTMASLVRSDPKAAESAALDLADLLRAAMRAGTNLVTLGEELELCSRYLAIEQLRLGERLRVRINLESLNLAQLMPLLSVQPLVENAVLHGIASRSDGGLLEITGEITAHGQRLRISNPLAPEGFEHSGNGIAQANVRARLKHALGEAAELHVRKSDSHYICELELPEK